MNALSEGGKVARAVFFKAVVAAALAIGVQSAPAAAQQFSEGYQFLDAVKDRDGTKVTAALGKPGSTIVNTRDVTTGQTALHIVTARRDTAWIRYLLQQGANPNVADAKGDTPLIVAANLGHVEAVTELAKGGARVDVSNSAGETPLIGAVHRRDLDMVKALLANGGNPDRTDNSGRTARDYARLENSSAIIAALEEARAKSASAGPSYGPRP